MKKRYFLLSVLFWGICGGDNAYAGLGMKILPVGEEPKTILEIEKEQRAAEEAAQVRQMIRRKMPTAV